MKTAAMIALYDYELWQNTLDALAPFVDHWVFRFDGDWDSGQLAGEQLRLNNYEPQTICRASGTTWNRWEWREQMLRELDNVQPDLVLCPDEDEIFGTGLQEDIKAFMESDKRAMMFAYKSPIPTDDGEVLFDGRPYPGLPHMKAFKWRPGLTYRNYTGFARVTDYYDPSCHYHAKTLIHHFCCWTKEMRKNHEMKW